MSCQFKGLTDEIQVYLDPRLREVRHALYINNVTYIHIISTVVYHTIISTHSRFLPSV